MRIKRSFLNEEKAVSEWYIDGQKVSSSVVQKTVAALNIQLSNLCQFLPQDRVNEFAKMGPVQLLAETQKAVASDELVNLQSSLMSLREKDRSIESVCRYFLCNKQLVT